MDLFHSRNKQADPTSRNYSVGLYAEYHFNENDFFLRRRLGFCAVKIFSKKDTCIMRRELDRNSITDHLVVSCSKVIINPDGKADSDVLYLPFGRSLDCALR